MITKITGEQPFQVLTNNFSISPSNEGYTLQISADGKNFSNLFSVGAGVTRLVTGVAANSYYRLLGNQSEVSVNWMKVCVTEGGGGAAGNELVPQDSLPATADAGTVVALTSGGVYQYDGTDWIDVGANVDLTDYWTSAQTKTYVDSADTIIYNSAITYAQSAITGVENHLFDVEEVTASALTELHEGLMEVSARTIPDMTQYTPTSGFATVNGSAITNGGDIVIETGSGDMHMLEPVSEFPISADTGAVVALNAAGLPAGFTLVPTIITPDDGMDIPRSGVTLYAEFGAASGHNYDNPLNLFKINNVQVAVSQNDNHTEGIDLGNIDPEDDWFNIAVYMYIDSEYAGSNSFIEGVGLEYVYTSQSDEGFEVTFFPSYNYDTGTLNPDITVEVSDDMGVFQYDGTDWVPVGGADMSAYYTSAQTEDAITNKNYITSAYTGFTPTPDFNALSAVVQEQQIVFSSGYNELHTQVMELSAKTSPDVSNFVTSAQVETQVNGKLTAYTPTTGFSTINGSAVTNGGNIVIQGGGGGGISQADLASSGYVYFSDDGEGNFETNLDNTYAFLKGNDGDGYPVDPPQLVDYDAYEDGTAGTPPFPKHLVTIYRSDYDDLVNNGGEDSETFYIVLPDPGI